MIAYKMKITFFGGKFINNAKSILQIYIFTSRQIVLILLQNQLLMNFHHSLYGKTVATCTLGCKLNFSETSYLLKKLTENGLKKAKTGKAADICVINTCSVTDTADKKCRQAIRKMIEKHPNAFVVVIGCYAQLKPKEIADIEGVNLVLGTNEKFRLLDYLQKHFCEDTQNKYITTQVAKICEYHLACSADDRTRFFLKIQDGCNYYCTYCTIPFARGRSRNASIAETTEAARDAIAQGAKEIVLSGVNIGDFGRSTNETFFDLIQSLDAIDADVRYRISSIEPDLLTDEMIDFVANSKHFAPHFHLPLQSGCDEVLKLMKRRYTCQLFADKVNRIKSLMPNAFIGMDVMVGARGETPEYFEKTRAFLTQLDVSQLHIFTYSERAGTKALENPYIVPQNERKRRSTILHALSEQKLKAFYDSQKGKTATVLWEATKRNDLMSGFTENYVRVEAPYRKEMVNCFETITL